MREMDAKTNSEHQERLKKNLKKSKAIVIFDFLLKYGSLSKAELSSLVGQNSRSRGFHYSFNELKNGGYVEEDPDYSAGKGRKFRLADKAFKAEEDRPKVSDISTKQLVQEIALGLATSSITSSTTTTIIESRKTGPRRLISKKLKKENPVKNEDSDGVKVEEMEPNEEDDKMDSSTSTTSKKKRRSRKLLVCSERERRII